jgi:diguanylate cyclase (GGDEF)-like protein
MNMTQQILVIDDAKNIHSLVNGILTKEQVAVNSAFDGNAGIALAASLKPDLILLDVDMPEMNGYEVCKSLKANPDLFNIPVVFLTSLSTTQEKVHGLEMGAVDYITKPFSPSELLARVRATLRTSRAIRMLEEHALIDFLTGLGNRAMFKQRLAAEVSLRVRTKKPLACVVVDVDNFQGLNDTYGHPFADGVLRSIAQVIEQSLRAEDVPCRLGGDAFAIIAPNTETEDATLFAERIYRDLNELEFTHNDKPIDVKCSVVVAPAIDTYDRGMVDRASAAMDEGKRSNASGVLVADRDLTLVEAAA